MPISRLRLHLAAWFGAAFLLGLVLLDLAFLGYSWQKADSRLTRESQHAASSLLEAIRAEQVAQRSDHVASAVREVLGEWPGQMDVVVVQDDSGVRLGSLGPGGLVSLAGGARLGREAKGALDLAMDSEGWLRLAWARAPGQPGLEVRAGAMTAGIVEEGEILRTWLLVSAPLLGLAAATAGYALARRGLTPVQAMANALDAVHPDRLDTRLPVGVPPDELDQLAVRFNALFERLTVAREANRRFLAMAAHQLRTPLTVVRGESALGLERSGTIEEYQAVLRRIRLAAEQMSRRVEELFLLAEAEAGERPALTEPVALDDVVLEATDLMRGRASNLGRRLTFGRVEEAPVVGSATLLREAVMELLENACRHGSAERPVGISLVTSGTHGRVEISNAGAAIPSSSTQGLGLSIVRWVAELHGGTVEISGEGSVILVTLLLPLRGHANL